MKQYRNYFKNYYKLCFGKDYEVHHIDLNHNNNDISNLMLLPKELHSKYHSLLNDYKSSSSCVINFIITGNKVCSETYIANILKQLLEVLEECNKWYDYKLYLDGKLPNIHGIDLRGNNGSI